MIRYIALIILLFSLNSCLKKEAANSILLNYNWKFSKENDSVFYKATVPGVIHTDLFANNLIEDPFWETNELKLQWIEDKNWIYKTSFKISKNQLNQDHIELEFEGLDTYATVFLNGKKILETTNMFRTWKTAIKRNIQLGKNSLEVHFTSPLNYNRQKVLEYPYKLPSGNEKVDLKVSPFTRKSAYQFGWDWGPRFVTSGIWKNVKINTWNKGKINDVFIQTDSIIDDKAYLTSIISLNKNELNDGKLLFIYNLDNGTGKSINIDLQHQKDTIYSHFVIENAKLWWPNGMGKPTLYKARVELKEGTKLLDTKLQNFGIRTIELIQEQDTIGTSFYFKINGTPLFIKGANYIPQDVFLPRVSERQYKKLFAKVIKANMNMLRVWGGGIYEKDIFYELCDKNGILVWQDFMFAGSLYPNNKEFIDNVKEEVKDNVTRLRKHPSIALWCGNNEIEVAWKNWGWQQQYGYSKRDSIELWNSYKKIFKDLIPTTLKKLNSNIAYVHTTPLSNWGAKENFNHSSMHYWGVWHGKEPFNNFKTNVGRFMVEYGFQSFPSMKTIQTFASDSSLSLQSKTMINRQKSYIGNGLITKHIKTYFEEPSSFEDFVVKSQQTQAIALQIAIQSHRKNSPHCMGTLFWQLNDCWPGPSWSIIDYYGRKKDAFNTVKENFKPVIAVLDSAKKGVEIISNLNTAFHGSIQIILKQHSFSKIIFNKEIYIKSNDRILLRLPKAKAPRKEAFALNIELKDTENYTIYSDNFRIRN